jgi:hypothetical protein
MKEFFKRGANLLKLGLAARQIKKSTTEDNANGPSNIPLNYW